MAANGLMRGNLGMALVCMVGGMNSSHPVKHNTELQVGWSPRMISIMHMFFYVGTFLSVFAAHLFAQKFGAKAVIMWGIVVNVVCTWTVPAMVYTLPHFLFTSMLRFAMGVAQGFYIPCASLMIAHWFADHEKSTAMAIFTTGNQVGLAMAISPVIVALCLCSFCQAFVMVSMVSYLPEYHRANGMWSSMPFVVQIVSKIVFASAADEMKRRGCTVNMVTKLFNSIACFGCAACLLVVSLTSEPTVTVTFLTLGLALTAGFVPGYNTSIVCVAPPFTAAVSAYTQAYAQVAATMAPLVIGFVTTNSSIEEWSAVFQILVGVLVLSGLCFQFFGSAKVQPWAMVAHTPSVRTNAPSLVIDGVVEDVEKQKLFQLEDVHDAGHLRTARRSPKVSIRDENGDVFVPGVDSSDLKEPL
ncbi:Protein F12B6.2 c [Aphelenchoides avenae]|nr:Protein F12B6.2 c [Aphelenchus avenae]